MPLDERVARSVALEQAYVHDVYEQFYDNPKSKPWPKVEQFLQDLEPGSIICDIGCGNGKYLNVNASTFNIGGDKSIRLTETAREKENEVLVLDNLSLPFRDESLDAVLSIAVVHHLATAERRIRALREIARVLRIGGRLIISVWAMEQTHRKFESQDVLVPWHRPKHLSTPSLELLSTTTTTNTSEDDCLQAYQAYTQTSDSDSTRSKPVIRKRGKTRHKGRSIDPGRNSSPSSSSLSSPNETCYSFVRRALQKLAGGRRAVNRPWFLESWSACTKEPPNKVYDDTCHCCDCTENVQDIPIELRRIDNDEDIPQRRQTFPSSQLINDITNNLKSKSMTNIKTTEENTKTVGPVEVEPVKEEIKSLRPKLVKQKQSICEEEEAEEALDEPTDMKHLAKNIPDFKIFNTRHKTGVFKQRSLNEELMSTDRLQEKERLRQNIQKQTSLNEDMIYERNHHTFDSFKDSFFSSVSSSKRFQLIKTGFTNKIKNSTTIERVTSTSIKNGFVRMFQNWKSTELEKETTEVVKPDEAKEAKAPTPERRQSKEEGSDSSKDSSLQSDTSVDSEDSFASVIFVPKSDPMSPIPAITSAPNSPRIKQSSCPTSPRIKTLPPNVYPPLLKQLSSPPKTGETDKSDQRDHVESTSLAQKYSVPQIPKFKHTSPEKSPTDTRNERLKKIKDLLTQKTGFGIRPSNFPIVRRCSVSNGKVEAVAKPLPKLLTLELFNPETDDKDSDSSCVSSPDSLESVINFRNNKKTTRFKFPPKNSLLDAAADVANSLDKAVEKVIRSSPNAKRKLHSSDVLSIIHRKYSLDTTPLLKEVSSSWDQDCHRHLTDFADKLSEKLLHEIDQLQEKKDKSALSHMDDPYIHRLSEELDDLSKLSAEIQKQNEYLARLSASDSLFNTKCLKCASVECQCLRGRRTKEKKHSETIKRSITNDSLNELSKTTAKSEVANASTDYDSDKGGSSSTNSIISSVATSINFGPSVDSVDGAESRKDTNSMSRYSDGGGSTASLVSCPDWKTIKSTSHSTVSIDSDVSSSLKRREKSTSQDSLPSDNIGGEITYHRYYHVFREGELDQLIEKYVENLHIISSYYDHASWCIIAEKVQVWTI